MLFAGLLPTGVSASLHFQENIVVSIQEISSYTAKVLIKGTPKRDPKIPIL